MPSPFPGMDPWLEEPSEWVDVHNRFATHLAEMLTPKIVPRYVARSPLRVYLEAAARNVESDVARPPFSL